jgi:hypothetical protein
MDCQEENHPLSGDFAHPFDVQNVPILSQPGWSPFAE